jgi:hypothetical protein
MDTTPTFAWQPLTPRGVAAFASAPWRRLLLVQFVVAMTVAAAVAWFLYHRYFPLVSSAILQLPAAAQIRQQQLHWQGDSPVLLAENPFLALSVDVKRTGELRSIAHVQVELTQTAVLFHSLFGSCEWRYPPGWIVALNRDEAQPFWGAWRPVVMAGIVVSVIALLFGSWMALAILYVVPVWLFGLYLNRQLTVRGSWRLSGAALMPGAMLMVVGLSFYDLGVIDLVSFLFVFAAHLLLGWGYTFFAVLALSPEVSESRSHKNPFPRAERK